MTSNWPPLVAMSVVTRWRSTFSSSTTQFSLLPVACLPLRRQLLHDDHVGVVDRGDGQLFRLHQRGAAQQRTRECGDESGLEHLGLPPLVVRVERMLSR